jgi:hypothetical protein
MSSRRSNSGDGGWKPCATGTETEMNVRNCHQDGRYCLHRAVAGPRVAAILVPPDELLFLFGTEF